MEKQPAIIPLANIQITDRELRHLAAAWLASGDASIDFEVFTILTGHPNSANARKRFGEIKKRVRDQVFHSDGEMPASVPSTPKKRKTKANGDVTPSPAKKSKASATKQKKIQEVIEQENYEAEAEAVKKEFAEYALNDEESGL